MVNSEIFVNGKFNLKMLFYLILSYTYQMKYLPVVDGIPLRDRRWAVDDNYVQDCGERGDDADFTFLQEKNYCTLMDNYLQLCEFIYSNCNGRQFL